MARRDLSRALAFVAHRLLAERVALVLATREVTDRWHRYPQLRVDPLGRRDARALLESVLPARLDESVLERILTETRGNPLALLKLPRGLSPGQLAGGFGLPTALPLAAGIEQSFARRLGRLPRDARQLLLLASAEPVGDLALLWRAAEPLGITQSAAHLAETEGLVTLDGAVSFRHPLVRSAVYGAAEPSERRSAHQALADATDPRIDPDRRAWHRAQAASVPDEEVATELEQSAARAQARGGFAAAGAFLERAAELTPDPVSRARRVLTAAQTTLRSGALDDTLRLLSAIEVGALDELESALVELLRAQVAFVSTHGSEAPALLLQAARRLTPLAPTLASETYLEALSAAMFAGPLAAAGASTLDVSLAALAAPRPANLRGPDLLLDGLATFFSQSYAASVPILRQAEQAFDVSGMSVGEQLRWKWLATVAAVHLWDDVRWEAIAERHVQIAREVGAVAELPLALNMRAYSHLFAGDLSAAESLVDEIRAAGEATASRLAPYGAVGLAAFRGRPDATALIDDSRSDVARRGEGIGLAVLDWAQAVLYNGLGRYEEARAAALRATELPHNLSSSNWGMAELVEAAARSGSPDLAADACARISEMSTVSGTAWARGVAARSQALLANDEASEALFQEAIEHLERSRMAVDLARAHLLFGEWLRRQRRRVEAREHLRAAHERFSDFGMQAFADRARVELEATGEHARKRTQDTLDQLTPQEAQISRLVAQGNTNRQVAAQLFISSSTVEYHLRKAFRKLGVSSRTQLARRLQG